MQRSRPASSLAALARERKLMASSLPIVVEAKCPSAAIWSLLLVLLLPAMAAAAAAGHGEEMKSIYAGPKVLPVRLGRPAFGPESLAFDHRGGGPYTGVSNGRVLRWRADRRRPGWTEFAHNYKHATVAECAAKKKVVAPESLCGRPLGLQFHRRTGDMYIADAYLGLMRVGRRGGLAEVVATEAGGVPFNFVNGVDVDQDTGDVYFTDSSTTYQRRYVWLYQKLVYYANTVYIWLYATSQHFQKCIKKKKHDLVWKSCDDFLELLTINI
ncbi:hypothetical protein E2562_033381 [Oryza meyeriana var. granulata]|uniref:Uncharacterized protein n=1 Tax=Oryza meyeriana var. granulata TaxID=110450 RepID=A0A6G1C266_9ORYZ|nr:hypothetical protein E2562_033381 [Oryza meyeriana var. granulata]